MLKKEKKGEQIYEQNRSVPLVVFTYGRVFVFNFLLCREFSRDNEKTTSHSAYDMKFHSPKVLGIDKQMCRQDTRLLGNVSGVYSRVVFFECLLWKTSSLMGRRSSGIFFGTIFCFLFCK